MAKQKIRIKLKAYDHRVLDASVRQIVDAAEQTGAQVVGPVPLPTSIEKYTVMRATFIDNLAFAAGKLKEAGIRLLVEPINTYDIPGFYLSRTAQAIDIIDAVGSDNLFVQYDIYHAQRMEGELANTIVKYLPRIAHMQLADNPGRNEPGTGEINFAWLFRHIDNSGYDGWIGCEYKPAAGTREGLGWIEALTA